MGRSFPFRLRCPERALDLRTPLSSSTVVPTRLRSGNIEIFRMQEGYLKQGQLETWNRRTPYVA